MGLSEDKLRPKIYSLYWALRFKDLINSDKTGLDPTLLPVLNLRVFDIMDRP